MSTSIRTIRCRVGFSLLALVVTLLLLDAFLLFTSPPAMVEAFVQTGLSPKVGPKLALVTSICALLLVLPATSIVGAILTTAFLGGAIATRFRIGEIGSPSQIICLALGVAVWAGLYLRDDLFRELLR